MAEINQWGVPFSTILWFESVMKKHSKVVSVKREKDILFTIIDNVGRVFKVLLLNEYILGVATLMKALDEFPEAEYIVIGGDWNKCTDEAKEYGDNNNIGIFNFSEFMGAVNSKNPKSYTKIERKQEVRKPHKGA